MTYIRSMWIVDDAWRIKLLVFYHTISIAYYKHVEIVSIV